MMKNIKRTLLVVLLVLIMKTNVGIASSNRPLIAVEVETIENTLDGCIDCGCRLKGVLDPGKKNTWWFSFGVVKRDAKKGWEVSSPTGYCGIGAFRKTAQDFGQTIGAAYIFSDLSISAAILPGGEGNLKTQLKIQKLSGFDKNGKPVYSRKKQKRKLSFSGEGDIILPMLIADGQEKEPFGIHEVLLRIHATLIKPEQTASYGTISVSADIPGAEVLLDGGYVGRIAEGSPLLLKNVFTGSRQICVRDFSGREARKQIVVEKNHTIEVKLKVLGNKPAGNLNGLIPIGKNQQGYEEYLRVKDNAIVVKVPAGKFLMGSAENEGKPDERPQHQVYVSEFLIDKTEVTWRQFREFVNATGKPLPPTPLWGTPDDYPVSFVLWEEAEEYCEWVGGRLPTEAEWEKAARGIDGRKYPWGDEWDPDRCNSIDGGPHRPESAGSFPDCMSPYGVLDMSGSVWEWCADWYGENYYSTGSSRDPAGPPTGRLRVIRGGAWMSQPLWMRAAYRFKVPISTRKADHGFRCVQGPPEKNGETIMNIRSTEENQNAR